MNLTRTWIQMLCLVSLLNGICGENVDKKEYFCGKKLVKTLAELCSIYNSPKFGQRRFRRQIVQECCRSQCSRRYLVEYYCLQANSSVLHELEHENTTEPLPEPSDTHNYQADGTNFFDDRNSLTVGTNNQEDNKQMLKALTQKSSADSPHSDPLPSSHNKITRRKRNCKCRKRKGKRIKKSHPSHLAQNMIRPMGPPANIGIVENSQTPFYVGKFAISNSVHSRNFL